MSINFILGPVGDVAEVTLEVIENAHTYEVGTTECWAANTLDTI